MVSAVASSFNTIVSAVIVRAPIPVSRLFPAPSVIVNVPEAASPPAVKVRALSVVTNAPVTVIVAAPPACIVSG